MIVRWGLDALPEVLGELDVRSPLLVAGPRWDALELPLESGPRWKEVPSHRIDDAAALARDGDGVVALGGGSAIDLGKAISAAADIPLVSIPTTYAGAEWTTYFGVRDPERKMRGGGAGARPEGIVYDVELTLDLPRETTVGTSMNALAHCAEALYVHGHNEEADEHALAGARLIAAVAAARRRAAARPRGAHGAAAKARATAAPRSAARCSRSVTRWRRRSAAVTGCRTER